MKQQRAIPNHPPVQSFKEGLVALSVRKFHYNQVSVREGNAVQSTASDGELATRAACRGRGYCVRREVRNISTNWAEFNETSGLKRYTNRVIKNFNRKNLGGKKSRQKPARCNWLWSIQLPTRCRYVQLAPDHLLCDNSLRPLGKKKQTPT